METYDNFQIDKAEICKTLTKKYFEYGYKYQKICDILKSRHSIQISLTQLNIKSYGLRRKNIEESPISKIAAAVLFECAESGSCLGYRSSWLRLKKEHGLTVKCYTVSKLQGIIDFEGKELRKRRRLKRRNYTTPGPNYMIHIDGYDKLKVLEIYVQGGIDGFSRKLLWLKAADTNKNPKVVAGYFLRAIKKYKCLPTKVRADKGTENVLVAKIQRILRF